MMKLFWIIVTTLCALNICPIYAAPPNEPLLQQSNLQYLGAFRIPYGKLGTVSKTNPSLGNAGGRALSYNPINNSLFMMGDVYEVLLAEINIPSTIVNSPNISNLTTATVRQNPLDITGGKGCFTGPIQTNPLLYNYGGPSSMCPADDFSDHNATIKLSAKTGHGVTVTTTTQWDASVIKPGFFILEPNGGTAYITTVTSSTLTVDITTPFNNTTLINTPANSQTGPGWYLRDSAGMYLSDGGVFLGGVLVDSTNNKLIGSVCTVFDGAESTSFSHFTANLNWSSGTNTQGMYRLGSTLPDNNFSTPGFVGGYMGWIPSEWQSSFGKNALTGMAWVAVMSRASFGPGLFAFNSNDVESGTLGSLSNPVPITPLLYYPTSPSTLVPGNPNAHQNLGNYATSNVQPAANQTSSVYSMVFPSDTSSILFFGRTGMGPNCYGIGTMVNSQTATDRQMAQWIISNNSNAAYNACNIPSNKTPDLIATCIASNGGTGWQCGRSILGKDMPVSPSANCCYDNAYSDHGVHAWPYHYYVWAYDAHDLLHVKNRNVIGSFSSSNLVSSTTDSTCSNGNPVHPWCILPYAQWDLGTTINGYGMPGNDGVLGHGNNQILGAAYDPVTQRIYLSQSNVDSRGLPLIQVYQVNATSKIPAIRSGEIHSNHPDMR